jgi:hypothetical protein
LVPGKSPGNHGMPRSNRICRSSCRPAKRGLPPQESGKCSSGYQIAEMHFQGAIRVHVPCAEDEEDVRDG